MPNPNHDEHGRFSSGEGQSSGISDKHVADHATHVAQPLQQARQQEIQRHLDSLPFQPGDTVRVPGAKGERTGQIFSRPQMHDAERKYMIANASGTRVIGTVHERDIKMVKPLRGA